MTTLDSSKLHRILTMAEFSNAANAHRFLPEAQAIWHAAQIEQREEDVRICDDMVLYTGADCAEAIRSGK